ncbi:MAG: SIMPL domain-containing protein [bacterium]
MDKPTCCGEHKWLKISAMVIGILAITAIVIVAIIRDRIVNVNYNTISVVGQGKVSYQPDVARVSLGVQVDKVAKVEDALNQLNAKIEKIYKAIENLGIDKNNIELQNYSLLPNYDYKDGISVPNGYNANQVVVVKISNAVENVDLASKVIVAASIAGANQINSVTYEYSKMNQLKQLVRLQAIADAKSKARPIADNLGVRVKEITGMWENIVSSDAVAYDYGKGGMGAGGVVSGSPMVGSGRQELIMEVNISYKIK